jgi:DNA polymerase III subunit beta
MIVSRDKFRDIMAKLGGIVSARNTIMILSNIKLETADGKLFVTMTNLDIEAVASIECDGEITATTVDGEKINSILAVAKGDIEIGQADHSITLKSGRAKWKLPTLPSADYPIMSALDGGVVLTGPSSAWSRCLSSVSPAQSTESSRYYLCGTYLHNEGDAVAFVALDGRRCHKAVATLIAGKPFDGAIIPAPMVAILIRALPDTGDVSCTMTARAAHFAWDGVSITAKLIEGNFSEYEKMMPKNIIGTLSVDANELVSAISRIMPVADHKERRIICEVTQEKMTITNMDNQRGEASDDVSVILDGDDARFGINGALLLDMVKYAGGETITMSNIGGAADMGIMTITPTVENGFIGVIAPMRI